LYEIDLNKKIPSLNIFLARPNRVTIGKLNDMYARKLTVNFGQINELTFTIPYDVVIRNELTRNPHVDNIREKYFIRMELGIIKEWFIITKLTKSGNDSDSLIVECKSLGYQLYYQKMIDYNATSYNCTQVLTDCLSGTGWTVGYINPDFNLKYRQFDVSSSTKLDFVYSIGTTFDGIPMFDTENKKVNIYKEEEISQYKGFIISYGKYLNTVQQDIDADQIVTRMHVKGSDNLTINSVNPTGQDYIDDFSYFLYPFSMDENGNVLTSSYYMDDDLAKALVNYNSYVSSKKDSFAQLLTNLGTKQTTLTTEQTKLSTLKNELQLILDDIQANKTAGLPIDNLLTQQSAKTAEITNEESVITSIQSDITSINNQITNLKNDLKMENHLSAIEMDGLYNFIQETEWSDDNQIDANDLYNAALTQMDTVNSPPVTITVNIIDFFQMITEQRNWDRLSIGDIVKIKHDKLNILVKTKVSQLEFDFDNATINVTISNSKELQDDLNKTIRALYTIDKVNTDYNARKINWSSIANNFNSRNDRLSEIPTKPTITPLTHTINDNGSANISLSWTYPDYNVTGKNEDNIDGFLIYIHSDTYNVPYVFGSKMASESIVDIINTSNTYVFQNIPPNLYYTIGIRAYRRVDNDINPDGIIMSDIVVFNNSDANGFIPYQPSESVVVKADIQGSLNGVTYYPPSTIPPSNPKNNDRWTDMSETLPIDKIYDASTNTWKQIVNTQTNDLAGKPSGIATLDDKGNVPLTQLGNIQIPTNPYKFIMGNFKGDGTGFRTIALPFTAKVVKVYTTNTSDISLYINSNNGGYKLNTSTSSVVLVGMSDSTPYAQFGKLGNQSFIVGQDSNLYGNKSNVTYYYEAYAF
jgi:phage minor structural protein